METREEHLQWCKQRAMEYVAMGDLNQAFASMTSDIRKHPENAEIHRITGQLGMSLLMAGELSTVEQMSHWINGYN